MKTNPTSRHHKGFTLVEMLVVITIIVILAALSVPGYSYITLKQANSQADLQINLLSKGLEEYRIDYGAYPDSADGSNGLYKALYWDTDNDGDGLTTDTGQRIYVTELDPVHNKQGWTEGTGANVTIVDPWGREYIYRTSDDALAKNPDFDLASKGKDGLIDESDSDAPDNGDNIDNY